MAMTWLILLEGYCGYYIQLEILWDNVVNILWINGPDVVDVV